MKKLFIKLIIASLILTSCMSSETLTIIYKKENIYEMDFRKYTEKGFLFTTEKYNYEYESIGLISYEIVPGAEYKCFAKKLNPYYTPGGNKPKYFDLYQWFVDDIIFSDVLDSIYVKCTNMGADAFVNFDTEIIFDDHRNIKNRIKIFGCKISGFAIKRK